MDAEVQAFKDAMAEKNSAKEKVLPAIAAGNSKVIEEHGISGAEGKAMAKAQAIADKYVKAHPDKFANVAAYVNPDGLDKIVHLIDIMREAGMEEAVVELTMFELANFERQNIGATPKATVRLGNGG